MKVSAPSSKLAGEVDLDPICRADNSRQCPFGENFPAAHTGALRHMFDSLDRFLGHYAFSLLVPLPAAVITFMLLFGQQHIAVGIISNYYTLARFLLFLTRFRFDQVFGFFIFICIYNRDHIRFEREQFVERRFLFGFLWFGFIINIHGGFIRRGSDFNFLWKDCGLLFFNDWRSRLGLFRYRFDFSLGCDWFSVNHSLSLSFSFSSNLSLSLDSRLLGRFQLIYQFINDIHRPRSDTLQAQNIIWLGSDR